jgi:hypothetical protein
MAHLLVRRGIMALAIGGSVLAVGAMSGCASRNAWERHQAAVRRFDRLPADRKRAVLHDDLRKSREPHDTYIMLIGLADESTVPLLLYRLREDFGASGPPPEPPPPRQLPTTPTQFPLPPMIEPSARYEPAYPCVWGHLIDALISATNTNRGMYYPAWREWWEANQHRSRREWIHDGFVSMGLHVTEPVDERFARELLELASHQDDPRRFNALRLLAEVPRKTRD